MRLFAAGFLLALCACNSSNEYDHHEVVGASAHDLLSDERFPSLRIEIQAMEGNEPSAEALETVKDFLESRLQKPEGIEWILDPLLPAEGESAYSAERVRQIEEENRLHYTTQDRIYVYVLFLDGGSPDDTVDTKILGYAHQNTSVVIFEPSIRGLAGGFEGVPIHLIEATVLAHEFGHLLGLVDLGSPMQTPHLDESDGVHCDVPTCLMHSTSDGPSILATLQGGNVPELDVQCLDDLQANGGR